MEGCGGGGEWGVEVGRGGVVVGNRVIEGDRVWGGGGFVMGRGENWGVGG